VHRLNFTYPVIALLSVLILVGLSGATPGHSGPWQIVPFPLPSSGYGPVDPSAGAGYASRGGHIVTIVPEIAGTPSGCANASLGDPYPETVEGNVAFNGNLFALPTGAVGGTSLCYHAGKGTLTDSTRFTSLPGAKEYGVLGYPEAILGQNIYGGISGQAPNDLPLPRDQIHNLTSHSIWVHLNYSVNAPGSSPYDFAFDDWFSVDRASSSSTGNVGNRIEVMIWLSNDIGMYLPQTKVSVSSYFNGTPNPGTWYRDQICQASDFLTFDYLFAPTGKTPGYGATDGRIAFNLSEILDNVASVMKGGTCWASAGTNIGSLWADNFPIGAEFYPTTDDTASVSWSINSFYFHVF
jgi:hypothetical protein